MSIRDDKMHRPALIPILAALLAVAFTPAFGQGPYPDTIAVIKSLYAGEMQARQSYAAYAEKAASENLPEIAALFDAFALSESIHARNFRALLEKLGQAPPDVKPTVAVKSTRENLRHATDTELAEIDMIYPTAIAAINAEKHAAAAAYTRYAWLSEKQHRALISDIQSGTGLFFGLLKKKLKQHPRKYFICRQCGSTLTRIPQDACPICGGPASNYKPVANK